MIQRYPEQRRTITAPREVHTSDYYPPRPLSWDPANNPKWVIALAGYIEEMVIAQMANIRRAIGDGWLRYPDTSDLDNPAYYLETTADSSQVLRIHCVPTLRSQRALKKKTTARANRDVVGAESVDQGWATSRRGATTGIDEVIPGFDNLVEALHAHWGYTLFSSDNVISLPHVTAWFHEFYQCWDYLPQMIDRVQLVQPRTVPNWQAANVPGKYAAMKPWVMRRQLSTPRQERRELADTSAFGLPVTANNHRRTAELGCNLIAGCNRPTRVLPDSTAPRDAGTALYDPSAYDFSFILNFIFFPPHIFSSFWVGSSHDVGHSGRSFKVFLKENTDSPSHRLYRARRGLVLNTLCTSMSLQYFSPSGREDRPKVGDEQRGFINFQVASMRYSTPQDREGD
ncbi:hypothetical protein FB451DRAFT_1164925 [Mycena latifolia]|nr:hypothetical protein FB451DRAFT_1164925 [Mycena latifolia]